LNEKYRSNSSFIQDGIYKSQSSLKMSPLKVKNHIRKNTYNEEVPAVNSNIVRQIVVLKPPL